MDFIVLLLLALIGILLYLVIDMKKTMSRSNNDNLEDKFRCISNDVLISNQQNFMNLAKETFDKTIVSAQANLENKQNTFMSVLNPIKETLTNFNAKVDALEKERVTSYSDLKRQISDLMLFQQDVQKTTAELSKALSAPPSSGQWGEMQLKRTVELSGMLPYCDFVEQQVTDSAFSRLRPDMIIRLPGDRNIIVDAKTSLNDYMQYMNTGNQANLDEHIRHIKKHIRDLSTRAYWDQFSKTPEFVLMFLPGESFFSTAIKADPTLLEFGIKEKVIITTPLTLIAVLKAIACTWRQEAISENAKQIGEIGIKLQAKLEKLFDGTDDFRKKISKMGEIFDKFSIYINREIMPLANKLKTLGSDKQQVLNIDQQQVSNNDNLLNNDKQQTLNNEQSTNKTLFN